MAERNFDKDAKKGHKFTLGGREYRTHAGMSLNFLMDTPEPGEEISGREAIQRTLNFIRTMIIEDDRPKWDEMLADSSVYIDSDTLTELFQWLIEVASGRPTKRPPSSTNGAGRIESPSKESSSSAVAKVSKTSRAKKPSPSATPTSAK